MNYVCRRLKTTIKMNEISPYVQEAVCSCTICLSCFIVGFFERSVFCKKPVQPVTHCLCCLLVAALDSRAVIILHCVCTSCFNPSALPGFSESASVSTFGCKHLETRAQNGCLQRSSPPSRLGRTSDTFFGFTRTPCLFRYSWSWTLELLSEGRMQRTVPLSEAEYLPNLMHVWVKSCLPSTDTYFSVCRAQASLFGHNDWGVGA